MVTATSVWRARSQINSRKCRLCGNRSYSKYCKLCEYTLLQIEHMIQLYLDGTPPEKMDWAVAEFDRIYYSNMRLRVFYNTACEAVHCVLESPSSPMELIEPNFSSIPQPKVISILEESRILSRQREQIYAGELLTKLYRLRLMGFTLSSEELQKELRIVYAILTLSVTRTLLEHEEFIPQIVTGIFRSISAHIVQHMQSKSIPREMSPGSWNAGFRGMNRREVNHIQWDLLGLSPNTSPRIFSDYDTGKDRFVCKECMVYYFEYIRERIRERERGRLR